MDAQDKGGYDDFSAFYDRWHDRWGEGAKADCIGALATLAAGQPVLELGVGTGRLALPLALAGHAVTGIDQSRGMLAKLRAKPGAEAIDLVCGDLADVGCNGRFGLIYSVLSFGYLLAAADQIRCFRNVAAKLLPGGAFVIQTVMPGPSIFQAGAAIDSLFDIPSDQDEAEDGIMLLSSRTDVARQRIRQRMIAIDGGMARVFTDERRYVWPSELDLLGELAGLRLEHRWGHWDGMAFTGRSPTQISVFRAAPA